MRNRKLALILSFVFPGLGQVCKGEVLKGLSFMAICALLIASVFFSSATTLLYRSGLAVIVLMWLVGILDVYVDYEFIMRRKQWLLWQRGLVILPIATIATAIAILIMLWTLQFSERDWRMFDDGTVDQAIDSDKPDDMPGYENIENGSDVHLDDTERFAIQVGAFGDQKNAEEVCRGLLARGYMVRVQQEPSAGTVWYRVLIGNFLTEQAATEYAEELQESGEFSDTVVRSFSAENEVGNPP